jgi:hypothetical protein
MVSEPMEGAGTDSPEPEQRLRMARAQTLAGGNLVPVDLVIPGFNLNHHDFPLILRTDLGENVTLVDFVGQPGEFFAAVTRLQRSDSHIASIRHCRSEEKLSYSPSARIGNSSACRRSPGPTETR